MSEFLASIVLVVSWLFVATPALGYREEAYVNYYSTCFRRGAIAQFKFGLFVGFLYLICWAIVVVGTT